MTPTLVNQPINFQHQDLMLKAVDRRPSGTLTKGWFTLNISVQGKPLSVFRCNVLLSEQDRIAEVADMAAHALGLDPEKVMAAIESFEGSIGEAS